MIDVWRDRHDFNDLVRRFFGTERDEAWLKTEEFMDGKELVVRAEMPGIDPEKDVELTVGDGVLHIRAERREHSEHKEKDSFRSEFRYGSFFRDVLLPKECTPDDVHASYKDGVLEVRLPYSVAAKPEMVKVPVQRAK
jgi:HSP20 family protein